jgi:hypothetical protein
VLLGDPLTNRTDRTLLAVLLNPPRTTPGVRTRRAVERAGRVLGYDGVTIVNLCPRTRDPSWNSMVRRSLSMVGRRRVMRSGTTFVQHRGFWAHGVSRV